MFLKYLNKLKKIFLRESSFSWYSACRTDIGLVRKANEDACFKNQAQALWVVADGMGGHDAGDWASQTIVEHLKNVKLEKELPSRVEALKQALQEVNFQIYQESVNRGQKIGSTVVVLHLYKNKIACLWAGDSRVYRWRKKQLQQLTTDHSLVESFIQKGLISPVEAQTHPAAHIITRAIGVERIIAIDTVIDDVQKGDSWLLCSDGLGKEISDDEIARLWRETNNPNHMVEKLIALALERNGRDNITVCIVQTD